MGLSQIFVPAQSRCSSPGRSNEMINLWGQLLAFLSYGSFATDCKDLGQEVLQAANAILRDFYVDDCILGASSIEEARESLCALISKGEMTLRKWKSNCQTVMDSIVDSLRETCNDSDLLFPSQSPKGFRDSLDYIHRQAVHISASTQATTKRTISF